MGSVCCCFRVDDHDDQRNANASVFNNCICLNFFTTEFFHMWHSLFGGREMRALSSSAQVSNVAAIQAADDSTCDTYRSPPRPLAYDDPRCSHLQHHGLISRHGKTSSQCHGELDGQSNKGAGAYAVSTGEKWNALEYDNGSVLLSPESSLKKPPVDAMNAFSFTFTTYEDEDSCPICLEEYTPENPCITMQCSHDFHLGCIYEWMERSDGCPICGKVMVFEETT